MTDAMVWTFDRLTQNSTNLIQRDKAVPQYAHGGTRDPS